MTVTMKMTGVLMLAWLAVSCINDSEPATAEYITTGMRVPAFTVEGAGGIRFESPSDFADRTTLLVFFATWCPQCGNELPAINEVWESLREDAEKKVIAISRGGEGAHEQSETIISAYWAENGYGMPWYMDPDRHVFDLFAESTIPRMYIIDRTGTVVWYGVSPELDAAAYLGLLERYGSAE